MFPLFTFASLTRVLTRDEQSTLGGALEWGLVPEEPMGTTVRRTRDRRKLCTGSRAEATGRLKSMNLRLSRRELVVA
jgi:hypothetical protein